MFKVYLSRRQTKAMSSEFPIGDPTGGAAYREMRDPATAMAASAGANVIGSVIGGEASKSAAKTQANAAANASAAQQRIATQAISDMQKMKAQQIIELQNAQTDAVNRGQRDRASAIQLLVDQRTDALARIYGSKDQALGVIDNQRQEALQTFQPYMQVGQQGVGAIGQQLPYFQQTFGPEQFKANLDPGYEFMKQQGLGAIRQGMNVGGGGSNIDRAATKFAEDYANTGYQNAYNRFTGQQQNIYNRLAGIAGIGQTDIDRLRGERYGKTMKRSSKKWFRPPVGWLKKRVAISWSIISGGRLLRNSCMRHRCCVRSHARNDLPGS